MISYTSSIDDITPEQLTGFFAVRHEEAKRDGYKEMNAVYIIAR